MIRIVPLVLTGAAILLLPGCASIVSGQNQSVSVATKTESGDVPGAKCQLNNDKGTWFVTTPGSVTVRRSFNDLALTCAADGYDTGTGTSKSATKGMAFGNILFGGVVGAGVDVATGAAYDYPDVIVVQLKRPGAPSAPQPAQTAAGAAAASAAAPAPASAPAALTADSSPTPPPNK